jgi:anti-anti-sigma regulatory factor
MGITLDESGPQAVIGLEGAVDISSAAELKALLLRALNSGKKVRVSYGVATDLDVTAAQLLWAAGQEASKAGVDYSLAGPALADVNAALSVAGLGLQQFLVSESDVSMDAG